jgi:hypothetical protein
MGSSAHPTLIGHVARGRHGRRPDHREAPCSRSMASPWRASAASAEHRRVLAAIGTALLGSQGAPVGGRTARPTSAQVSRAATSRSRSACRRHEIERARGGVGPVTGAPGGLQWSMTAYAASSAPTARSSSAPSRRLNASARSDSLCGCRAASRTTRAASARSPAREASGASRPANSRGAGAGGQARTVVDGRASVMARSSAGHPARAMGAGTHRSRAAPSQHAPERPL